MTRSPVPAEPGVAVPVPDGRDTSAALLFDSTQRVVSDVTTSASGLPASEEPRRADRPTPGWWRWRPSPAIVAAVVVIGVLAGGVTVLVTSAPSPDRPVESASTLPTTAVPLSAPPTFPTAAPPASDGAPPVVVDSSGAATPPAGGAAASTDAPRRSDRGAAAPPDVPAPAAITPGEGAALASGPVHSGRGTYYAATGTGSCMFDTVANPMVAAIDQQDYAGAQACGAYLAVTGPTGRTVTVRVVDICHECAAGSLNLSQQAFARIAPLPPGQTTLTWRLVSPALTGPVTYLYSPGSSTYWCGIQVRNHRNPVQSLAVRVRDAWQVLQRRDYNAFESPTGAGCGNAIRITDIFGEQLTDTGIAIRPGVIQAGSAQFGPPD